MAVRKRTKLSGSEMRQELHRSVLIPRLVDTPSFLILLRLRNWMAAVGTVGPSCAIGVEAVVRNVHPRQRRCSRAFARLKQLECNSLQAIGWFLPMGIETSYSETTRDPFCLNIMIT